eukprot:jgi/Bigna1/136184/aug1.32_g10892
MKKQISWRRGPTRIDRRNIDIITGVKKHNHREAAELAAKTNFFALTDGEKRKYELSFKEGELLFGYAAVGAEKADIANLSLTGKQEFTDLMESFQVADPAFAQDQTIPPGLEDALVPLYYQQQRIGLELLELCAESLNLPKDFFAKDHTGRRHRTVLRVTRYPALSSIGQAGRSRDPGKPFLRSRYFSAAPPSSPQWEIKAPCAWRKVPMKKRAALKQAFAGH